MAQRAVPYPIFYLSTRTFTCERAPCQVFEETRPMLSILSRAIRLVGESLAAVGAELFPNGSY
jgi:hypothetical protein